jgi:hypothetical protein
MPDELDLDRFLQKRKYAAILQLGGDNRNQEQIQKNKKDNAEATVGLGQTRQLDSLGSGLVNPWF